MTELPTLDVLERAAAAVAATTVRTPLVAAPAIASRTGAGAVWVKAESMQVAGSFKVRGATWRLLQLSPAERARGVIAYSSGNFAQGLAAAGARLGIAVTIVMPHDAPAPKREGTLSFGADIIDSYADDRPREEVASALAKRIAAERGLTLLHPFDDPHIVAGQASAGMEALDQLDELGEAVDLVLTSCGGGGLSAGIALAFHHRAAWTETIAVEPLGFDGLGRSLLAGVPTRVADGATICDALQATAPGSVPLTVARAAGMRGVAVDDNAVEQAVRVAFSDLKLVLEPSGAAALAALMCGAVPVKGRRVLVFATGGNVAADAFAALLAPPRLELR